jgi:hypothetical protein
MPVTVSGALPVVAALTILVMVLVIHRSLVRGGRETNAALDLLVSRTRAGRSASTDDTSRPQ